MAPITIPEGFAFVARQAGVNVAAKLFDAVEEVKADRYTSVRTVTGGYHVQQDVADAYAAALGEEEVEEESTESTADADETKAEETKELEALPVTEDNSHAEIDDYASKLDPKVEFPANTNKADKIKLLEEARQPKTPAE